MNFIKRWILTVSRQAWKEEIANQESVGAVQRTNNLHDMLSHNMAAMVAFRINNGYLVRVHNPDDEIKGRAPQGFTYCADHKAIADYLIASSARDKLGVQQDLFRRDEGGPVIMHKNTVSVSSQPHGY